jgi:hypothetical protein
MHSRGSAPKTWIMKSGEIRSAQSVGGTRRAGSNPVHFPAERVSEASADSERWTLVTTVIASIARTRMSGLMLGITTTQYFR